MQHEAEEKRISKFLSLVLRHNPGKIGIELDANGWTNVDALLEKLNANGVTIDKALLQHIVDNNPKKRFAFNKAGNMIRANQGHSIEIDLGYKPQTPPEILYHGTSENAMNSILQTGLEKRERHHDHLSADMQTALQVGQRHGKPVVFEVLAGQMSGEGMLFYVSDNGVWLTEFVPVQYLKKTSVK
jgi:putative RNA 2'-phosphotransferase